MFIQTLNAPVLVNHNMKAARKRSL